MEKSKFQTVVQGEASESDDDEVHVSSVNIKPFPSRVLQTSLESKVRLYFTVHCKVQIKS